MIEAYRERARTVLNNTGQEAWLEWAGRLNLMPRTQEAVAERDRRLQCEEEAQQEQQRREAEQRRLASLRIPSNSSRGAVLAKKASQTSVAGVDVEMASEVGLSGTARTGRGAKSTMPDSDNPPVGAVKVRRSIYNSISNLLTSR
jgi:hypothetical protein